MRPLRKVLDLSPLLVISLKEFKEAFGRYHTAMIIQTGNPKKGQEVGVAIDKEALLSFGGIFALALVCVLGEDCVYPSPCHSPHLARPAMDAFGVDVGKTIEPLGFSMKLDKKGKLLPAWYSMVLLD